ncbi:phosphotransferase [Iamia sp. SCSIO 61187]|uniref:phosphotransferase family protein n=1 Tax=Iamia sp. SCSIO 61187 TaxID=2722752 RepID=UPI001C63B173|nr:phosphotransferase [Iamia sp. SCSIO 61187]QYG92270.1 phosphotransferase [Iamia sp. SCSIO 61187]
MDGPVDEDSVRRVVARMVGPGRSLSLLGQGTDHVAYDVDGAFVARVALDPDGETAAAIARERAVLDLVGPVSPVPVPEVVAADPDAGVVVLRRLPGASLLDEPCRDVDAVVDQLAAFLTAVWSLPVDDGDGLVEVDDVPLEEYRAEAAGTLERVAAALDEQQARLVAAFLAAPPPAEPPGLVLTHNDLGAEHLLAAPDRATLTGVIDWSDAAVADPARDLGRIHRDLGPDAAARLIARLDRDDPALAERAAFHARCALLEDLEFGLDGGDRRYRDAALGALVRVFAGA